jgi:hypothetical protein
MAMVVAHLATTVEFSHRNSLGRVAFVQHGVMVVMSLSFAFVPGMACLVVG